MNVEIHLVMSRGVCNFLGFVLFQQKFEVTDRPVLQPCEISLGRPVLQLSVTVQFYEEKQRIVHPGRVKMGRPKSWREERPPAQFWLLFLCVFFPSL